MTRYVPRDYGLHPVWFVLSFLALGLAVGLAIRWGWV